MIYTNQCVHKVEMYIYLRTKSLHGCFKPVVIALRWTYTIWSFLTTFGHLTGEKTEMNFD